MAGMTGLEPATSGVTGQRSNQLSYTPVIWCITFFKGQILLNQVTKNKTMILFYLMVGGERLELPTLWM